MRWYTSGGCAQEEEGTTRRIPCIWREETKRDAKDKAIGGIRTCVKDDLLGETPVRRVGRPKEQVTNSWEVFDWTASCRKGLPSPKDRETKNDLK